MQAKPVEETNILGWDVRIFKGQKGYFADARCNKDLFATTFHPNVRGPLVIIEQRIRYWKWLTEDDKVFYRQFAESMCTANGVEFSLA